MEGSDCAQLDGLLDEEVNEKNLHNCNPEGKNQYNECSRGSDEKVNTLLIKYNKLGITNKDKIKTLLKTEGIIMSATTVKCHRKELGLKAASTQTKAIPESKHQQLIMDELTGDHTQCQGPGTVKEAIQ
ncbi:hypothetical protein PUNSTDRAFT_138110 [Punctularia strigosozonata HHB-11173 SS5]|uniref:Uncharacterized protein n=1 Tax=Punctularia strigosozonata (strain HHB-11173) TaxID=741275 RepID=R7S3D1_PUNST|nr:uncharacterized protein PUNSTDRAFT_138110 [Punctularia strigosozonata HHB-11173 SS5]EIN04920.1 hypothetical protein PUNSTDRAFT_138110 [Punctularia strigosozonata HHB-11173 SS5]